MTVTASPLEDLSSTARLTLSSHGDGAKECERGGIAKSRPWVDLLTEMEKDFRDELQVVGQTANEKKRIGIS